MAAPRLVRLVALAGVLLALGACGGETPASPPAAVGSDSVARAAELVRSAGTLSFEAEFVETKRKTGKRERYMTVAGALDLAAGEGRAFVDLTWMAEQLAELAPGGAAQVEADRELDALFGEPIEVRWNDRAGFGRLEGRWHRATREQLRSSLFGRAAEEPAQLLALLVLAEGVTAVGTEVVDDVETTRVRFTVDARRAGGAGVPAELYRAFEAAQYGPELDFEAWLDGEGLPRRIAYWFDKDDVRSPDGTKVIIPAKTIRAEYRLFGFGDDVDTSAPAVVRG